MITFRVMKAEGCGGFVHATCSRVAALPRSLVFPTVLMGLVACLVASSAAADATVTAATHVTAAAALPAGVTARGLDVSAFQHAHGAVIDWSGLARQGIGFVGIKVSEGTYYANPYYASDARDARAAGITVLPYVFANPQDSGGAATATYAISASSYQRNGKTLPLAVDLENDPYTTKGHPGNCYGLRAPQMVAWITAFASETAQLTGVHPVIYTTADWWRQCTGNTALFRQDPLWVAAYGVPTPAVPAPWQQWTFWQYTDAGVMPGVGMTDLDYLSPGTALSIKHASAPKRKPVKRKPVKRRPAKHPPAKKRVSNHRPSKQRQSKQQQSKQQQSKQRQSKQRQPKQQQPKKRTSKHRPRRAANKPRTSYRMP
jgi:GH25 family lysozyme M1 (1,4-beta-N-acetylmuramidase)